MARSMRLLAASLLLVLVAAPALAAGEANEASLDTLIDALRANRKAMVDVNLALTDEEAKAFWPVYDRYAKDFAVIQERLARVIEDYSKNFGSLTDAQATKLVKDYLAIESDRVELRKSFLEPFSKALPGRKLMRFYQIENKIDAVLRYQLASTIPVVEQ